MDPRHSGPVGGGYMKSDVGHRKYVLVKDMASRFRFRYRAFLKTERNDRRSRRRVSLVDQNP